MSVHRRAPQPLNVGLAGPRLADRSVTLSREREYRLFSTPPNDASVTSVSITPP